MHGVYIDYVPEDQGKPIDKNRLRKQMNGQILSVLYVKTKEKMKRESEMSQQRRIVDFTNVSRLLPGDTDR